MSDLLTDGYSGTNFIVGRAAALGGSASHSSWDDTLGLAGWVDTLSGAVASSEVEDASLLMYGDAIVGCLFMGVPEDDVVFTVRDIYASALIGGNAKARGYAERFAPEFARYLQQGRRR